MNGHPAVLPEKGGKQVTPKDFIVEPITMKRGLVGAKPERVCRWILDLLHVVPGDEVVDLFPGTGVMGRIASEVCQQQFDRMTAPQFSCFDSQRSVGEEVAT